MDHQTHDHIFILKEPEGQEFLMAGGVKKKAG